MHTPATTGKNNEYMSLYLLFDRDTVHTDVAYHNKSEVIQRQFETLSLMTKHGYTNQSRIGNKILLNKHDRKPIVALRNMCTNKVLCCIFFFCDGTCIPVQNLVSKGKRVSRRYYQEIILKMLKKYY
jgi:hypothetical protein